MPMNRELVNHPLKVRDGIARFVFLFVAALFAAQTCNAEVVELSITGYWTKDHFKVKDGFNDFPKAQNPKFDGTVFGVEPSAGEVTLKLLVNTADSVFFAKGSFFIADGVGAYELRHDFYGYRNVTLAGDTFTFGTAAWKSDGILAGLEGPERVKAALWTDVDITKGDPGRVSFRMFGKADGLKADLFVGSRTPFSIGGEFLLWEYYAGEEIRSNKYTVKSRKLNF
jgi:hypothetical protein